MIRGVLPVATYSIVGRDARNGDLGIAVQSRFLAVGAVVPWAKAGVGAMAVQSFPDPSYGAKGLALIAAGSTPEDVLETLTGEDEGRAVRQVGVVDAKGRSACFTGPDCIGWAGHVSGENFTAQGNMLVGDRTVAAMAEEFRKSEGSLADRLMAALAAAQQAGGDARGKQSAALLVVREGGGFMGLSDRYIDLRVDDHPDPIKELARLLELQRTMHLCVDSARLAGEGKIEEAIQSMEQAREREPRDVNVLYFLARTYFIAGRKDDAMRALGEACAQHKEIELLARRDKLLSLDS
jgi:uncharacterized Ntn-hydrolase superfamily protein